MYSKSSRLLLLNTFLITLATFMFNPYLVVGARNLLHIDYSDIGFYLMIALFIGSLTSLFIGLILPDKSLLYILILASAGSVLSFFLMSCSNENNNNSQYVFLGALVLLRICMACATMITRTIHVMTNINKDCSKLFATAVSVFGVGSAVAPLIGGIIYEKLGFIQLLLASMIVMFTSFVIICVAAIFIKSEIAPRSPIKNESKNDILRYSASNHWKLMIASVLFFCMMGQSFSYIPVQIESLGKTEWISIFFGVNAIFLTVLSMPMANLFEKKKIGSVTLCNVGLFSMMVSLILIPFVFNKLSGVVLVSILYSFGEILFSSYSLESLRKKVNVENVPKAISIYTFLTTSIGLGMGQYIGVELMNNVSVLLISATWIIIGVVGCILLMESKNEKNRTALSS
ncbi:MFS transporter [Vibrio sp. AK197]